MSTVASAPVPTVVFIPKTQASLDSIRLDQGPIQLLLERGGRYTRTQQFHLAKHIEVGAFGTGAAPVITFAEIAAYAAGFHCDGASADINIHDLEIHLPNDTFAVDLFNSQRVQMSNISTVNGGWVLGHGCTDFTGTNLKLLSPVARYAAYFGVEDNTNVNLDGCQALFHSQNEALLRMMTVKNGVVRNCAFDNTGNPEGKQAGQLRGYSISVINTSFIGGLVQGQLAGDNTDPPRQCAVANEQVNVRGYVLLEAGSQTTWQDCAVEVTGGGGIAFAGTWGFNCHGKTQERGPSHASFNNTWSQGGNVFYTGPAPVMVNSGKK